MATATQRSLFAEPEPQQNERIGRAATQFITAAHLDAAKDWPDWHECLMWAWEAEATVQEMQAWRRAYKGESK